MNKSFINDHNEVLNAINSSDKLILDARSANRFEGKVKEPREGLRSGHIPNSKNLPYTDLVKESKLLEKEILKNKFNDITDNKDKIIFSCGSGITACILALGAEVAGYKSLSVYDGSWTEWGSKHELPIENLMTMVKLKGWTKKIEEVSNCVWKITLTHEYGSTVEKIGEPHVKDWDDNYEAVK